MSNQPAIFKEKETKMGNVNVILVKEGSGDKIKVYNANGRNCFTGTKAQVDRYIDHPTTGRVVSADSVEQGLAALKGRAFNKPQHKANNTGIREAKHQVGKGVKVTIQQNKTVKQAV